MKVLRDGSNRDIASQNLNVVLNVRHDYDLDSEDITDLLKFRVAMIPKEWTDDFGDAQKSSAIDIAECLNMVLSETGEVFNLPRKLPMRQKPKKTAKTQMTWKERQELRISRGQELNYKKRWGRQNIIHPPS